jgi:Uncharacterised nucleotidyltransferase
MRSALNQSHLEPTGLAVRQVQPIAHRVAEALTRVAAGQTVSVQGWSALESCIGLKMAGILGLLPMLHMRAEQNKLNLDAPMLANWREVLAEQYVFTQQRNQRLLAHTTRILDLANRAQVTLMPLKGMDVLTQVYADIGLRSTSDIDLLVQPAELERATHVIEQAGFECSAHIKRHAIFALPNSRVVSKFGEHPDNPIKVELHTSVKNTMPLESCDLTDLLWRETRTEVRPGMPDATYPSRAGLMVYEMLHAANHAMIRSLRFPSLYDMKLLAERLSPAEWQAITSLFTASEHFWWAYVPLSLVTRYFGPTSLPTEVLALARNLATPTLRRLGESLGLSQFSVCDLRPSVLRHRLAFARNLSETTRYLRTQVLPTRDELNEWNVERTQWSASMTPAYSYLHRIRRWLDPNVSRIEI